VERDVPWRKIKRRKKWTYQRKRMGVPDGGRSEGDKVWGKEKEGVGFQRAWGGGPGQCQGYRLGGGLDKKFSKQLKKE